jgi:UDP-N-acetyl-D-galactosamine dehydrogenase
MKNNIAVVGLGYVGLPLALEFGKKYKVTAFDINQKRVDSLRKGLDITGQASRSNFKSSKLTSFTTNPEDLSSCNIYIITVPTPIDQMNNPDLTALKEASKMVAKCLKKKDIVIYESTVYPGATEEVCVPLLEKNSSLKFNQDFFCGYSPERINPGDKKHTLTKIKKVTSGSSKNTLKKVDDLYSSIITAGTYKASSIKIAEAAKVIENTQRDINIALMNELSVIFNKLNIDTLEVLKAAETKWNFMPFKPGLVGGHCIGVDPYYLTFKAQELGYMPEIILSGRKLNNNMPSIVKENILSIMKEKKIKTKKPKILMMGITFKENCPDIRNSKVIELVNIFRGTESTVDLYDPWADQEELVSDQGLKLKKKIKKDYYDVVIIAVPHKIFGDLGLRKIKSYGKKNHVLYDIKGLFGLNDTDGRL